LRVHDPYYSADEIDSLCGAPTLSFPSDLRDCDGIVLVTAHTEYRAAPVEEFVQPGSVIIDNFGTWRDKSFAQGVKYHEIGRPGVEDSRGMILYPEPTSTTSS
jgi:UDP-N-acetyl-D-mannosaminuronate dehydrogenase